MAEDGQPESTGSPVAPVKNDFFSARRHQIITLSGRERAYTIHNYEVDVHATPTQRNGGGASGSSKVQITTLANHQWSPSAHPGNMVANNNTYLVYLLEGRAGYLIRIINLQNNTRGLLKGFTGEVLDVAFAHASSNLLACVDEGGNVYVWDLDKSAGLENVQSVGLKLHAQRSSAPDHTHHRISWCPYMPQEEEETEEEEEEEEEEGWVLAASHGSLVEVYHLSLLCSSSSSGPVVLQKDEEEVEGRIIIPSPHLKPILDLALSPDGCVLATSSEDGHLKFWQVDWQPAFESKCLHDFSPHNGAPVDCFMFCDNHTIQDPTAQFWRFLVTGSNQSSEVKMWCSVSWKCLQTFHFLPPQEEEGSSQPNILFSLDLSSSYLLATDTRRMVLYVFQVALNADTGQASLTSLAEYLLTQHILSFSVSGHAPFRRVSEGDDESEQEEEEEEEREEDERQRRRRLLWKTFDNRRTAVVIKVYCIHNKSMQELKVKFDPPDLTGVPPEPLPVPITVSTNLYSEADLIASDLPPLFPPTTTSEETRLLSLSPSALIPSSFPTSFPSPIHSSLPSSLQHTPTGTAGLPDLMEGGFHSLPSQTAKLVTPSAFLSPAQMELPPSPSSSSSLISASSFVKPHLTHTTELPSNHPVSSPCTLTSVSMATSIATLTDSALLDSVANSDGYSQITVEEEEERKEEEEEKEEERRGGGEESFSGSGFGVKDIYTREEDLGRQLEGVDSQPPYRRSSATESSSSENNSKLTGGGTHTVGGGSHDETDASLLNFPSTFPSTSNASRVSSSPSIQPITANIKMTPEDFTHIHKPIIPSVNSQQTHPSPPTSTSAFHNLSPSPSPPPPPLRPQQIFSPSADAVSLVSSSEFVATDNKQQLPPTPGEGDEIVNAAGTPSNEYFELFNHPKNSGQSSAETNEMVSSYRRLSSSPPSGQGGVALEVGVAKELGTSENGASAWPDMMVGDVTGEGGGVTGEGGGDEGVEEGEVDNEDVEGSGGGVQGEGMDERRGQGEERGEDNETISQQCSSVLAQQPILLEPASMPGLSRLPQLTDTETGQDLPVPPDHAPQDQTARLLIAAERSDEEEEEEEEEVRSKEEVEETTGASAPSASQLEGHRLLIISEPTTAQEGVAEVGVAKTKSRKKKSKPKHSSHLEAQPLVSYSDGESSSPADTTSVIPTHHQQDEALVGGVDQTHLSHLYALVVRQQEELRQLREDQQQGFLLLRQQLEVTQRSTVEAHRASLSEQAREQQQRLDRVLKEKQTLDRQRQDRLITSLSQTLTTAVNTKLEKLVKTEMKSQVTPVVNRHMATLHDQISSTLQQKLTATNSALKEGITQLLQSKGLPEAIGASVASYVQNIVQRNYEEIFRVVVMPSFEKSCQEMFRQMDDAFRRGTAEYLSQLHQLQDPHLQEITSSLHTLHSLLTSPQSPLTSSIHQEMQTAIQSSFKVLSESLQTTIHSELEATLQRQAAVRDEKSQKAKKEEEIQSLVQSRDINTAFDVALTTSDLQLVLNLCNLVSPEEIFDCGPCPLSQPVLLSLIQQLSFDLSDQVELKIKYLEGCLLALDVDNEVTRSNMPRVLPGLAQQLQTVEKVHKKSSSSGPLLRQIKRLRMATESLCLPH